jgi:hypothetical protein
MPEVKLYGYVIFARNFRKNRCSSEIRENRAKIPKRSDGRILHTQQPPQPPAPLIQENTTIKVSEHVYVIPDGNVAGVPNVGIVVGNRATLVVDTGSA